MIRKKIYGEYKKNLCPICNSTATINNKQGIPFCQIHKNETLEDLKCSCGSYLDVRQGKYGPFFVCINCGILNLRKGLTLNGFPLKSVTEL